MRARGEKITMLTAYDATYAAVADAAGVECILVGDSLGMVCQGLTSTVGVTLESMRYHVQSVARGLERVQGRAWVIGDLPFGSYQASREEALLSATVLMQAGAQMVKLEGGAEMARTVGFLARRGIPVCAHLGLTPQSVHKLGGYRVQGRGADAEAEMLSDARTLEEAGADMVLMEAVPARLAAQVTEALDVPTIGIGAGVECSGQVLVLHDMLDVFPGRKAKFVRNFMQDAGKGGAVSIGQAVSSYVEAVKDRSFPAEEHSF